MSLPDFYQPRVLRDVEPTPRELAYGIGVRDLKSGFGMVHGPAPLELMLDMCGKSGSYIIRFNADGSDDVIYFWDSVDHGWRKIPQERPTRERMR